MRPAKPLSKRLPSDFVVVLDDCLPKYLGQVATVRRYEGKDAYITLADGQKKILFQGEWRIATEKERLEFILTQEAAARSAAPPPSPDLVAESRPPDTYDVTQDALQHIIAPGELDIRTLTDLHASLRTLLAAREALDFEVRRVQVALARREGVKS